MAPAPARLSSVVVPALIAGLAILAACTDQTRPSATPTELPLSPPAAAVVTEEHLGTAFAGYQPARTFWLPESTTSVALHYRATPVRGSFTVLVGVGGLPIPQATQAARPATPGSTLECPTTRGLTCTVREGTLRLTYGSLTGAATVRDGAYVSAWVTEGSGPDSDTLAAVVGDPRLAPRISGQLRQQAEAYPRWRDGLDCAEATAPLSVPLAPLSGEVERVTPQALSAVVAGHVPALSAAELADGSGGVVYLDASGAESVSAAIVPRIAKPCSGLDDCTTKGEVSVGYQVDVPAGTAMTVRLTRTVGDRSLVVTHRSRKADPASKAFPVPLTTLLELVRDDRLAERVPASVNATGEAAPMCWRLTKPTDDD